MNRVLDTLSGENPRGYAAYQLKITLFIIFNRPRLPFYSCEENMNLEKNADIKSSPRFICPVTGLPVLRRPEWTGVSFGKDYRLTLSILGDTILLNQASKYVTLFDVANAFRLIIKVPIQAISGDRVYVQIPDYFNLQGSSLEA